MLTSEHTCSGCPLYKEAGRECPHCIEPLMYGRVTRIPPMTEEEYETWVLKKSPTIC